MFDSHCHIHFPEFDYDRDEVLKRAYDAGVTSLLLVGCDVETSKRGINMAGNHANMRASIGIHPHDAKLWSDEVRTQFSNWIRVDLESHALSERKIVAIGEIGLDFYRNLSSPETQRRVFREQLDLAKQFDLPVIIHSRDAHEEVMHILLEKDLKLALFHCFTGDISFAKQVFEHGWYISFSGIVTYPSATELRKVAEIAPLDKFLVETDCPYLPPQPYRGKRNEPAFLKETVSFIASIRHLSFTEIDLATESSTKQLFFIHSS